MKGFLLYLAMVVLLTLGSRARAAAPPQGGAAKGELPSDAEALAWDRDFDLLLELSEEPTPAEIALESKIAALDKERQALVLKRQDLRRRLEALQVSFTSETLLNEMLRLGVSDLQTVQKTLRDDLKRTDDQIRDIDFQLKRLKTPSGGG